MNTQTEKTRGYVYTVALANQDLPMCFELANKKESFITILQIPFYLR